MPRAELRWRPDGHAHTDRETPDQRGDESAFPSGPVARLCCEPDCRHPQTGAGWASLSLGFPVCETSLHCPPPRGCLLRGCDPWRWRGFPCRGLAAALRGERSGELGRQDGEGGQDGPPGTCWPLNSWSLNSRHLKDGRGRFSRQADGTLHLESSCGGRPCAGANAWVAPPSLLPPCPAHSDALSPLPGPQCTASA